MIEKINIDKFKIIGNYVLLQVDPNYNFKKLKGPNGTEVFLEIADFGEQSINHVSISGTVVAMTQKTYFYNISEADTLSQAEHAANMKNSLLADVHYPIKEGDKVYFNYSNQISAEAENRLVETDEHGILMLVDLNTLFGYEKDGQVIPLNGNVFFVRDEEKDRVELEYGLVVVQKADKYAKQNGTVKIADKRVRRYLEGDSDPYVDLQEGQRILVDHRFGYRMAYDMHGGDLKSVEVILRKHIISLI